MKEIEELLNAKYVEHNTKDFISSDPISIPHRFTSKEDIEISAFLTATISWGRRASIISNADRMMQIMDHSPHDFIVNHKTKDLKKALGFVHRTFNESDLIYFFQSLKSIYQDHGGLESAFYSDSDDLSSHIEKFRSIFFLNIHETRTQKHVSSPSKGSASKRICMFLRWMVREDPNSVDFGIWRKIKPSELMLPLDVHTAAVSRKLGLLTRKSNDWKAVTEISNNLKIICPEDPIKYDFALFGLGAIDGFCK